MNPYALRDKFIKQEIKLLGRQFMAPYSEGVNFAHVKIDKVVYPFRIVGCKGRGFGVFSPIDGSCARFVQEADIADVKKYMSILPSVHFILCYETNKGWIGYPMNINVTSKTLGLESAAPIKNVSDCQRFDVIVARYDSVNFWYDEPFASGDMQKSSEMRKCLRKDMTPSQMVQELRKVKGLTPEESTAFNLCIESWVKFQTISTEERIKKVLSESGAVLGSYIVRDDNVEVRWRTDRGTQYTSLVKKDSLDVVSAGICLDPGTGPQDEKFNLRDLPYVMKEGEDRGAIVVRGI